MLDDLSLLRQWNESLAQEPVHLFDPVDMWRIQGGAGRATLTEGNNPKYEMSICFWANEAMTEQDSVRLTIRDPLNQIAKVYASAPQDKEEKLTVAKGLNNVTWDLQYPGAETFEGLILWFGGLQGPPAPPGKYRLELEVNGKTVAQDVLLKRDPRSSATDADLLAQFKFLQEVRDKLSETHLAIKKIREIRKQLDSFKARFKENKKTEALIKQADEIIEQMTAIEERLYQTKNRSSQDPLNYPIQLNNRLSALISTVGHGDNRPTTQAVQVRKEVTQAIDLELEKFNEIVNQQVKKFNREFQKLSLPYIDIGEQP
jgi:hypothetical protein